jgi:phosphoribosylamine--glycine ligase
MISGLDAVRDSVVYHAGTAKNAAGEFVTAGGRVLGVTAAGPDLPSALRRAYGDVERISFRGMQYRRDIGRNSARFA